MASPVPIPGSANGRGRQPPREEAANGGARGGEAEALTFEALTFDEGCATDEGSLHELNSGLDDGPPAPGEVVELLAEQQELRRSRILSGSGASSSSDLAGDAAADAGTPNGSGRPPRVTPNDFELLRVVGQGSFGKVFQVRKKDTGRLYAMKVMRKEKVLEKEHGEYVRAESQILKTVLHPYIVTLRFSFQTSSKLYLVLDFVNGGHLFFQLYRQGIFSEELARLYTAEIVLAISHLHSLGFVHRDLKPENVLLDSNGHVKVTDFGLAKGDMTDERRTNSFIGTMEYMAPEIISGCGHGKAVDWWSVGVLLFEMLTGLPPFKARSRQQLQKQILGGKLKTPPYLSSEATALLKALLQRDPRKRLGAGPDGSAAVQAHPFFRGISWHRLLQRAVPSPFTPSIRAADSVENFDRIWTDQRAEDSPTPSPPRHPDAASIFEGFTYVEPSLLAQALASEGSAEPPAPAGSPAGP